MHADNQWTYAMLGMLGHLVTSELLGWKSDRLSPVALERHFRARRGYGVVDAAFIARECDSAEARGALRRLLVHVRSVAPELLDRRSPLAAGLVRLARQYRSWLRRPEEWRTDDRGAGEQFSALARHLLAAYPVPEFLDEVLLFPRSDEMPYWFAHVGQGRSLRTARGLSAFLTKRAVHHAMLAPRGLGLVAALRWGQVRAHGGSEELARELARSGACDSLGPSEDEQRIWELAGWLARQPQVTAEDLAVLLPYVQWKTEEGSGFSLKGRTLRSLCRLATRWHDEEERAVTPDLGPFPPSGLRPLEWTDESGGRGWSTEELLHHAALIREGIAMSHCVADFAGQAAAGQASFWSLRVWNGETWQRTATVQVDARRGRVVEAKARFNEDLSEEADSALHTWARENGLSVEL